MPDTATQERLGRLLGGGSDSGRGGLNVTSLFRPILMHVLDHGPSTLDELAKVVRDDHFMAAKEELLASIYGPDPWALAVTDGVEQLRSVGLLELADERWVRGKNLVAGKARTVIRKNQRSDGKEGITLAVYPKAEREAADAEFELRATFKEAAAQLYPARRGLRPLSRDRVAELVDSMRKIGFDKGQPITYDSHGRLLDGRHRLAAAKEAGVTPVTREIKEVTSDQEALEWAWLLNKGQASWTANDVKYVTRLLGGRHPDEVLSGWSARERQAAKEILTDPERTDREIAAAAGVGQATVSRARKKLIEAGQAVNRSPAQTKRERVEQAIAQNPEASNREIAREVGVSPMTVINARDTVQSDPAVNQTGHSAPESIPVVAPPVVAHPTRHDWGVQWVGDRSEAPERILRKLKREPDVYRELVRLMKEDLES